MFRALLAASLLLVSASSWAQTKKPADQEFVFPDEQIGGDREAPLDEVGPGPKPPGGPSLLQIRESFAKKVLESVSEL